VQVNNVILLALVSKSAIAFASSAFNAGAVQKARQGSSHAERS
jgi:hypothetical protein